MNEPLLHVQNLCTVFETRGGPIKAVNNVTLTLNPGEILGLVGESGSGKSVTGFSILGLIDPPGRITRGRILLKGEDLAAADPSRLRGLRGDRIAMIFQDPMMTLNPVLRIDTQMVEAIQTHRSIGKREALSACEKALADVGIPSPAERLRAYPHELSGGMRQRIAIAIAFLNRPDLIIADEPTTALDVTIQSQILSLAQTMCETHGTAMIWITHDLSVVAGLADSIAVMYAGRVVEHGPVRDIVERPMHPYSHGLLQSVPGMNSNKSRLFQIPGMTPSLASLGAECAFRARCKKQLSECSVAPEETAAGPRTFRCHNPMGHTHG
ncbi:MAG: ABC transporter ATP-binding protein [Pseudomonadota bacterium]